MSALLPASLLILAGCHHQDPVDTTLNWYHQYEGGIIAQQRAPAPGLNGPYPKVGLTPTAAPPLPSPALRQSITSNLITARNLSLRTEAQNGTLTPVIPPPPVQAAATGQTTDAKPSVAGFAQPASQGTTGQTAQPKIPDGSMGAVLDAADSQSPASPAPPPKSQTAPASKADEPEVALPIFIGDKAGVAGASPQTLPEIPAAPPPPPSFPGFDVPSDARLLDKVRPDYDLSAQDGVIIHFLPGSDQLSPGQDSALSKLAGSRGGATLFLHCSGEAVSMSAPDQGQAVELGLLRGKTLSDALKKLGVPERAMRLSGSAFGAGARVSKSG
ncbi:hypothetical protein GOB90_10435 [Acetobacter oeni]|nr:hypothetical protein [Acetobacter oeni]